MRAKWKHAVYNWFTVTNGVKQGGVLSHSLFAIYTDSLSIRRVMCRMSHNNTITRVPIQNGYVKCALQLCKLLVIWT